MWGGVELGLGFKVEELRVNLEIMLNQVHLSSTDDE
jgi:hypothetical protein